MTGLLIAFVLPTTLVLLSLAPLTLLERRIESATDEDLASIRQGVESPFNLWVFIGWGATTAAGAAFLLLRGQSVGIAWLAIAALWAIAAAATIRHRRRVLAVLGDRGRIARTERYLNRARSSNRWGSVAVFGYVAQQFVEYAYPAPRPAGAAVAVGVFAIVLLVGVIGFIAIRARMYLSGDDLKKPDVRS